MVSKPYRRKPSSRMQTLRARIRVWRREVGGEVERDDSEIFADGREVEGGGGKGDEVDGDEGMLVKERVDEVSIGRGGDDGCLDVVVGEKIGGFKHWDHREVRVVDPVTVAWRQRKGDKGGGSLHPHQTDGSTLVRDPTGS